MIFDVQSLPDYLKARLATKIRDVEFSTRTHNVLARENIVYVGDLIGWSEADLSKLWGFGKKCLREIKAYLAPGLELGMQPDGWSHQTAQDFEKGAREERRQPVSISVREPVAAPRDVRSLPEDIKLRLARRISDVDFSPRTHHALTAAHIVFVGDLAQIPAAELLKKPNFGRKSLNEVQNFLAPDLALGISLEGWTRETAAELEGSLRKRLEAARLSEFLRKIEKTGPIESLEDELQAVASVCYGDRRRVSIALSYFGWDGSGAKTLETVGQQFGLTRERIRQISALLTEYFNDRKLELLWLKKACDKVTALVPAPSSEIEQALSQAGITREPFRLSGIFFLL